MIGEMTAAIGFRVHSGWAAAVTVAGAFHSPEIVDRRRVELADTNIPGSKQPYHAAAGLSLPKAKAILGRCQEATWSLARRALEEIGGAHPVTACGMLLAAGRPLPDLESILTSHALIHTAEGEFFRRAIAEASRQRKLPLRGVKEKELFEVCSRELNLPAAALQQRLAAWGRALGPPWTQDEKYASLAAWLALCSGRNSIE